MSGQRSVSEAELHAFVDGELAGPDAVEVQAALAAASADMLRAREISDLNEHLRGRYADALTEPVPARLRLLAERMPGRGRGIARRLLATAAGIALVVGAGLAGYVARGLQVPGKSEAAFVASALSAHSVFVPEVRHPVEVGAAEEKHLVQWLTRRVGTEVRAPELIGLGWKLVGGRLLPDSGRPAAQLMYEDSTGKRLTLYLRKETGLTNAAFQFAEHGDFGAFYWIDRPLAYAIAGRLDRDELMRLAGAVYQQLDTPSAPGKETDRSQ